MARQRKTVDKVVVREAFLANGQVYNRGSVLDGKNPVVKGREHLFTSLGDVEQATAAPGEKRSVKKAQPKEEPQPEAVAVEEEPAEAAEEDSDA